MSTAALSGISENISLETGSHRGEHDRRWSLVAANHIYRAPSPTVSASATLTAVFSSSNCLVGRVSSSTRRSFEHLGVPAGDKAVCVDDQGQRHNRFEVDRVENLLKPARLVLVRQRTIFR
jgi:hypothetical protein